MRGHLVEGGGDGLDLLVIGGDASADQAVGRRHAVEEIDLDHDPRLLQEVIGRVESGGARSDDRDAKRPRVRAQAAHGRCLTSVTMAITFPGAGPVGRNAR